MKITKKQLIVSLISILIVLGSLAFMLCDFLIPLNVWTHPILNFFFCVFLGFGILTMVFGFIKSSPWYFFLSSIQFGLTLIYALLQYLPWWIGVVIVVAVWIIFAIVCFISNGNQTESIALNESKEYKSYEERKAEEENAKTEENEELPEIKSFND